MINEIVLADVIHEGDKVILFDGVCKLCNAWSRFIIRFDKHKVFKLSSVQSTKGQMILKYFNLPLDNFETMLYVEQGVAYSKSNAFLNIIKQLPYPFRLLIYTRILPVKLRDWIYDRIALNRYKLFGKHQQCVIPDENLKNRFL